MINPTWEREALISQVAIDLAQMEIEMEWQNGELQSEPGRQLSDTGEEVRNNTPSPDEVQRDSGLDAGTDDTDTGY